MEDKQSHPIPQDVTGFQFKLIGDMTVKQFAYLAGPTFLAWIFFQLPLSLVVKVPVSLLLAGFGAVLAFLPVAGRPMDVMIVNFIKALFRSTLYIYQKKGMRSLSPSIDLTTQKIDIQKAGAHQAHLNKKPMPPHTPTMPQEQPTPQVIPRYSPPATIQKEIKSPAFQQMPKKPKIQDESSKRKAADLEKSLENIKKESEVLEHKLSQETKPPHIKQKLQNQQPLATSPTKETLDLQEQLQTVLAQKEELSKQLMDLQKKLNSQKESYFTPTIIEAQSAPKAKPKIQTQNVRQVPKSLGKSVGLPTTPEAPNIITGIIKDPRGNPLGNILVEIKDAGGNPVRAFKTNGLGQFASATPLTNSTYTISFEDPRGQNKFDAIEFAARGEVILPLEVISVDTREELRKTLFKKN